jgi:hypothetical protein
MMRKTEKKKSNKNKVAKTGWTTTCRRSDGGEAGNGAICNGDEAGLAACGTAAALAQVEPRKSAAASAGMRVHDGF